MSGGSKAAPPRVAGRAGPRVGWWVLFALLAVAVVLLAWQPWLSNGSVVGAPTTTASAGDATSPFPEPTPTPTPTPTPQPTVPFTPTPDVSLTSTSTTLPTLPPPTFPGSDTVFGLASALELFVTGDQIASTLPAAAEGVELAEAPTWGLPTGAVITPPRCMVTRTIVTREPAGFIARVWTAPDVTVEQQVVLLDDPTAARAAFGALIERVDGCPQYQQVGPGAGAWTAQPAVEGQGLYPSIVQDIAYTSATGAAEGFRGHLLVGNAIVTWSARTAGDVEGLGSSDSLAAIVQDRALAAVRAAG